MMNQPSPAIAWRYPMGNAEAVLPTGHHIRVLGDTSRCGYRPMFTPRDEQWDWHIVNPSGQRIRGATGVAPLRRVAMGMALCHLLTRCELSAHERMVLARIGLDRSTTQDCYYPPRPR